MKKILILTAALALLLTGCRPELDFVLDSFEATSAEISGTDEAASLLFTSDEGQATVVFHSSGRWNAAFVNDRAAEWCQMSATEGRGGTVTVYVRVQANKDYDDRSASIVFTCDEVARTLVVTQKQKDALFLDANRVEIPCEGGRFELRFRTNVDCTVSVIDEAASWIIPAGTKGLTQNTLPFTVKANETLDPRQGYVTVTASTGKETLTVYQAGEKPTLVLGAHDVDLPAAGESFSVQVTSNLDVSYAFRNGQWLREVSTKTISTNTFYFEADRNQTRKDRQDWLVFSDKVRGVQDSIRIRQAFQPILAATDPLFVPGNNSVQLTLWTSGGKPEDFKVTPSASWLVLSRIEKDEEGCRILMKTNANRMENAREGKVSVYRDGYEVPDEVKVTQAAQQRWFSYNTRSSEVKAPYFAQSGDAFVVWGDGSYDYFDKFAGNDKDLVHKYTDGAKQHTIVVESGAIPWLQLPEPEDGMHFDFSNLKKKEED